VRIVLAIASTAALVVAGQAAAANALLPSPTTPIDTKLPLGSARVAVPPLLPVNARVANRVVVSVGVRSDGTVTGVRAIQRLTLLGTGDFFFQVPAPLRDVRAGPGSQGEPGFRRNAILWQGFANRRRILSSDATLVVREVSGALPLRIDFAGGALRLRNETAVPARAFSAQARPAAVRRVLRQIAADPLFQPSVEVQGAVIGRQVVVEAPLRVRGTVRSGGRVVRRFERVLGGPAPAGAVIPLGGAERPQVELTAEPVPLVPEAARPPAGAKGPELLLLATTSLLRLARVHQYDQFLANPQPTGPTQTVYRYRTATPAAVSSAAPEDDDTGLALTLLIAAGALLAGAGLVVLWAHS
jgi:hypothetical protein